MDYKLAWIKRSKILKFIDSFTGVVGMADGAFKNVLKVETSQDGKVAVPCSGGYNKKGVPLTQQVTKAIESGVLEEGSKMNYGEFSTLCKKSMNEFRTETLKKKREDLGKAKETLVNAIKQLPDNDSITSLNKSELLQKLNNSDVLASQSLENAKAASLQIKGLLVAFEESLYKEVNAFNKAFDQYLSALKNHQNVILTLCSQWEKYFNKKCKKISVLESQKKAKNTTQDSVNKQQALLSLCHRLEICEKTAAWLMCNIVESKGSTETEKKGSGADTARKGDTGTRRQDALGIAVSNPGNHNKGVLQNFKGRTYGRDNLGGNATSARQSSKIKGSSNLGRRKPGRSTNGAPKLQQNLRGSTTEGANESRTIANNPKKQIHRG